MCLSQGNPISGLLAGGVDAALVVDVDGGEARSSYPRAGSAGVRLGASTCRCAHAFGGAVAADARPRRWPGAPTCARAAAAAGPAAPPTSLSRSSLSRSAADATDAAGLIDVDWSPRDPYLVGGGGLATWDIGRPPTSCRRAARGGARLPHSGDAQPTAHELPLVAGDAQVVRDVRRQQHRMCTVTPRDEVWQMHEPTKLGHDLPTRVGALSWVRPHPSMPPMLVGCADSKVCLWALSTPGDGDSMGMLQ